MGGRISIILCVLIFTILISVSCEMDLLSDLREIQAGPPDHTASGVSFTDIDQQEGEIQGDVYIIEASDESDIYKYVLYWGSDEKTKLGGSIAVFEKTGGALTYNIPANTLIPDGATHFIVFSKNNAGEMGSCVSITINDLKGPPPVNPAAAVDFTDSDLTPYKLSGDIIVTRPYSGTYEDGDVTHYVFYWATSPGIRLGEPFAEKVKGTELYITTLFYLTSIPAKANYLLIVTRNDNGEMFSGVSVAILDRYPRIIYIGNGNTEGTVPADTNAYSVGANPTILGNTGGLKKINVSDTSYKFNGWNTQANGSGDSYTPGINYTNVNDIIYLYAEWVPYVVGDTGPAGGYIFYDKGTYGSGWRYLEVAPFSRDTEFSAQWATNMNLIGGTSSNAGDGYSNTKRIAEWLYSKKEKGMAAQLCIEFTYGGYGDWFLPSTGDLVQIYLGLVYGRKTPLGGFGKTYFYWSSTEDSSSGVYVLNVVTSEINLVKKSNTFYVRPVRDF